VAEVAQARAAPVPEATEEVPAVVESILPPSWVPFWAAAEVVADPT